MPDVIRNGRHRRRKRAQGDAQRLRGRQSAGNALTRRAFVLRNKTNGKIFAVSDKTNGKIRRAGFDKQPPTGDFINRGIVPSDFSDAQILVSFDKSHADIAAGLDDANFSVQASRENFALYGRRGGKNGRQGNKGGKSEQEDFFHGVEVKT